MQEILTPQQAEARGYISIGDALKQGLSQKNRTTLYREAQLGGGLPSVLVGKGSRETFWILKSALCSTVSRNKPADFERLYKQWLWEMESGTFTGKRLSKRYIESLEFGFSQFWRRSGVRESIDAINADNFRTVMASFADDEAKMRDGYSTKMHVYKACTRFLEFLIREGLASVQQQADIRRYLPKPKYDPQRDWLEDYEVAAIIKFNRQWKGTRTKKHGGGGRGQLEIDTTNILLHLYYCCGLRREEALVIKVCDIDINQKIIKATGKGSKQRFVTPLPEFWPAIQQWIRAKHLGLNDLLVWNRFGNPITPGAVDCRFEEMRKALHQEEKRTRANNEPWVIEKIDEVHPHAFRRAFAIKWNSLGMPLPDIQLNLGHTSIKTTMKYIPISIRNTQRWVNENIYKTSAPIEVVAVGEDSEDEDDLLAQMLGM